MDSGRIAGTEIRMDEPIWAQHQWSERICCRGLFTQTEIDDMARWESLSDANKAITPKPFASQFGTVKAGDIKYKDLNNDGQIDAYDQTYISRGDVPTTVYGFGFTVGWKDLSVGMMFRA